MAVEAGQRLSRIAGTIAAIVGAFGVMLGAFGAHALQGRLDEAALHVWHTAVEYQFWHALALLLVATRIRSLRFARTIVVLFSAGIVLFCGSLYALALGAPHILGAITPFGGITLIIAWLLFAAGIWRSQEF